MNYDVIEYLKNAREHIAKGWCQGVFARSSSGAQAGPCHITAVRWCSLGAIQASGLSEFKKSGIPALNTLVHKLLNETIKEDPKYRRLCSTEAEDDVIALWNDVPGRTQQEVLDLFNRTILKEEMKKHGKKYYPI